MKTSDKYLKLVEWSEADRCYVGMCPGLMLGRMHGQREASVYAELCEVVGEWIRIDEEDGEPLPEATAGRDCSGKFLLRTGKELHKELAVQAMCLGESLNTYCVNLLRDRSRGNQPVPRTARRRR